MKFKSFDSVFTVWVGRFLKETNKKKKKHNSKQIYELKFLVITPSFW